jgi:hypothetical protein
MFNSELDSSKKNKISEKLTVRIYINLLNFSGFSKNKNFKSLYPKPLEQNKNIINADMWLKLPTFWMGLKNEKICMTFNAICVL